MIFIPVAYNGIGLGIIGLSFLVGMLLEAVVGMPKAFGMMSVTGVLMILLDLAWRLHMSRARPTQPEGSSVFDRIAVNTWIGTRAGGQLMYFPVWALAATGFVLERFLA